VCDDLPSAKQGCNDDCSGPLPGWVCVDSTGPTIHSICTETCGDGIKVYTEACDDGNTLSLDGCTGCIIDTGYTCQEDMNLKSYCVKHCGNGLRNSTEGCDDGNTQNNDGCSSQCTVEPFYSCVGGSETSRDVC